MNLIHKVVRSRVYYPPKIKKIDEDIAKIKMLALKSELKRNRTTYETETLDRETEKLLNCSFRIDKPDGEILNVLSKELDDLEKVIEQITHDKIHILTREAIDSEAIIDKIKNKKHYPR